MYYSPEPENPLWALVYLALTVGTIVALVYLGSCIRRRPVAERAAWNEGFFQIDHDAALRLAEAGVGKTAEEVIGR